MTQSIDTDLLEAGFEPLPDDLEEVEEMEEMEVLSFATADEFLDEYNRRAGVSENREDSEDAEKLLALEPVSEMDEINMPESMEPEGPSERGSRPKYTSDDEPDRDVMMSFELPIRLREAAKRKATAHGISMSQYLRGCLRDFVEAREPRTPRSKASPAWTQVLGKVARAESGEMNEFMRSLHES